MTGRMGRLKKRGEFYISAFSVTREGKKRGKEAGDRLSSSLSRGEEKKMKGRYHDLLLFPQFGGRGGEGGEE